MLFKLKDKVGGHSENGKIYKAGDTIESPHDLVDLFPNKFIRVDNVSAGGEGIAVPATPTIPEPTKGEGVSIPPPPSPESKLEPESPVESKHGVDITDEFPIASKVQLQVFKKGAWYTVVDPDDGEVMNEKKLRASQVTSFLQEYEED